MNGIKVYMMKEKVELLNDICKNTLVENLGIVFTASGEDWLEARMPIDSRTCRPDGVARWRKHGSGGDSWRSFEYDVAAGRGAFPGVWH